MNPFVSRRHLLFYTTMRLLNNNRVWYLHVSYHRLPYHICDVQYQIMVDVILPQQSELVCLAFILKSVNSHYTKLFPKIHTYQLLAHKCSKTQILLTDRPSSCRYVWTHVTLMYYCSWLPFSIPPAVTAPPHYPHYEPPVLVCVISVDGTPFLYYHQLYYN